MGNVARLTAHIPTRAGPTRRWVFNSWLHLFNRRINFMFRIWQERPGECGECGFRDTRTSGHICDSREANR